MSDGFHIVARKKWIAGKNVNIQKILRNKAEAFDCYNAEDVDMEHFLKKLNSACLQVQNSNYFKGALDRIDEAITKLQDCNEINDSNEQYFKRLVCFGIGAFTRSNSPMHQLAFVLCTRKHYKITEVVFYDPILQNVEKEVLLHLDCKVMKENCEAKYKADVKTLFYLPHCAKCLTNNLLWRNWHIKLLKNIVLINNSFSSLSYIEPGKPLSEEFGNIADIIPYTIELSIKDNYELTTTFNDLSVHVFALNKLPSSSSSFWQRKMPVYKRADAVLVIECNDQNALKQL